MASVLVLQRVPSLPPCTFQPPMLLTVLGVHAQKFPSKSHSTSSSDQVPIIEDLLRAGSQLEKQVSRSFAKVAAGQESVDLAGLVAIKHQLSEALCLPAEAFGSAGRSMNDFVRFDLDGDGALQACDCYRLLKSRIRNYLELLSPASFEVDIPHECLQDKSLKRVKELGTGSFGTASLVADVAGNMRCLKIVSKANLSPHGLDELKGEYRAMQSMDNPWMAKTFGFFQDAQNIYFLNEAFTGGDFLGLEKRLDLNGIMATENWWQRVFRQCMQGLSYMHHHSLMHCDIKEGNLMLKTPDYHQPDVVFIDYGLSREFTCDVQRLTGTPGYIPPETFTLNQWYPGGDVFSLGVTMLQMLLGIVPGAGPPPCRPLFVDGGKNINDYAWIVSTRPAPTQLLASRFPSVVALMNSILAKEHIRRLTASQALAHSWLAAPVKTARRTRKGGCL